MTSIEYSFEFLGGIFTNDVLKYNQYVYTLVMYPATDNEYDHNVAFDRIRYLIDGIIAHSVFVNEEDHDAIMKLVQNNIPVLTIPEPGPIDQMIQFVLTAKIASIIEGTFLITESKIRSRLGQDVVYAYVYDDNSDDDYELVLSDSIQKWWNTPDPRFVSVFSDKEAEEFVPSQSWYDLDLSWDDELEAEVELEEQPKHNVTKSGDNIIHLNMSPQNKDEN